MHLRHFFFSKICRNFGRKIRSCKIFDKSQVLGFGAPGKAWVPKKTEEMRQIFVKKIIARGTADPRVGFFCQSDYINNKNKQNSMQCTTK